MLIFRLNEWCSSYRAIEVEIQVSGLGISAFIIYSIVHSKNLYKNF